MFWGRDMSDVNKMLDIIDFLENHTTITGTYSIDEKTLEINIEGSISVEKSSSGALPYKFGRVTESFFANLCNLNSLKNMPRYVGKMIELAGNNIKNFDDCPEIEKWNSIDLADNKLESLNGFPVSECLNLYLDYNSLTDLIGCPSVKSNINVGNNKLTTLKGFKSKNVKSFNCSHNPELESLEYAPMIAERFECSYCRLSDDYIKFFPKKVEFINFSNNNLSIYPSTKYRDCMSIGNRFKN